MKIKGHINQHVITSFMVLLIVLIAFLSYKDILNYFFTSPETLSYIEIGSIQSFMDIVRLFGEKNMRVLNFYRPIYQLSYIPDYLIWGLNPFGYHLTALILHILVSVLLFFLIRFLIKGRQVIAWFSAIIFTTHPILVENVPGDAHRQEILMALFLLLSLLLFLKYLQGASSSKYLLLFSLFSYALALGAKETAIIFLPLIFAYLMIFSFSGEKSFKKRTVQITKKCLPYFIVTFIYLAVRTYVVQGIGGAKTSFGKGLGVFEIIQRLFKIGTAYFVDLLYPVDFLYLNHLFKHFPKIGFIIALFVFISVIYLIIRQHNKIKSFFISSEHGKLVGFLLIWLFLPLGVYMVTLTFGHRYMYIPVIPFSSILSIVFVESYQSTIQKIRKPFTHRAVISFIIIIGLLVSLLAYSPLIRTHRKWEYTGNISRIVFQKFSEIIDGLPDDSVIYIYNLPGRIVYPEEISPVKWAWGLDDSTVKSWLNLNYPGHQMKVIGHRKFWTITSYSGNLDSKIKLDLKKEDEKDVIIHIIFEGR